MKMFLAFLVLTALSLPALAEDVKETTFDRTIRTGVIRCGYYVFPPVMYRDPNTLELSGFAFDYMNKVAERAGLKVEWTTEVTWANWVEELRAGRYDVACTPLWPDMPQTKVVTFSDPLFFSGISPLIRKDNEKLANATLDRLNKEDVTILTQEGNVTDSIAKAVFPNAKYFVLPPSTGGGEYYQMLVAKKADVTLTDPSGLHLYEESNGKIFKFIDEKHPVKLQSFNLATLRGEYDLQSFLNQSIREMEYNGDTDRLLRKWEAESGKTFLRVTNPAKINP